ncbi:MAG: hypothetical protein ABSF43_13325 [Rectinemataceae bacterium]|jgi:hypothetical protein
MMDSISVFLPDALAPLDRLAGLRPLSREGCYLGTLGGVRIIQGAQGVFVKGSLPKYLNGENALPLTRQAVREALGKLEAESGLDLKAGMVYQLETAYTLPVKEPPREYMAAWGPVPRFKKSTYGNGETVSLANGGRSFSGYDKGEEMAPDALPCPLEGLYALRLELRWKRGLKRLYGRFLNPWESAEPEPYRLTVKAVADFYFKIPKTREVCLAMDGMTPKGFERTLAALGLQALGLDRAQEIIRDGLASGALDRVKASRMRALFRELARDERITSTAPLTAEIDEKVRATARYAR